MDRDVLIGVTGPAIKMRWAWWATRLQLHLCGAKATYLTASDGYSDKNLDGVIIGGGNDIDPAIYGGDISLSRRVDPARDEFELSVLSLACERNLPTLGICRGSQLLNVHAGGSLRGDLKPLRKITSNRRTLLPRKQVAITANSKLSKLLGSETVRVNSLHHQSVDRVAQGFIVTARDRDNIVQGIEAREGPMRIGVQWHPEYMPQRPDQRCLFANFVSYCRERASR